MNKYIIIVSKEFNTMLDSNLSHLQSISFPYITYIIESISYFFQILETFPFAFPKFILPDDTFPFRKITIDKRYLIIYQITNNKIEILYFVDGRRSYENMLVY